MLFRSSIPLSFFAGIGGASREGVLVKGSNYLEILSQTRSPRAIPRIIIAEACEPAFPPVPVIIVIKLESITTELSSV